MSSKFHLNHRDNNNLSNISKRSGSRNVLELYISNAILCYHYVVYILPTFPFYQLCSAIFEDIIVGNMISYFPKMSKTIRSNDSFDLLSTQPYNMSTITKYHPRNYINGNHIINFWQDINDEKKPLVTDQLLITN